MIFGKGKGWLLLAGAALFFGALPSTEAASALPAWLDPSLTREQRLAACIRCHEDIGAREAIGPHINSEKRLRNFIHKVGTEPGWPPSSYEIVKNTEACRNCHAASNVYEGGFPLDWDGQADLTARKLEKRPLAERSTGTDCFTCHIKGNRVVTVADYHPHGSPPKDKDFCNPIASKTFSTAGNCATCHVEVPQHPDYATRNKAGSPYFTTSDCLTCHSEKGPSGKYTHYMYWVGRRTDEHRPPELSIFDRIGVSLAGGANGKPAVRIQWRNDFAPHDLMRGTRPTQYIVRVRTLDSAGRTLEEPTVRVQSSAFIPPNKPEVAQTHHDKMLALDLRGVIDETIPLESSIPVASFDLLVYSKPHVWQPDRYAQQIFERKIPLQTKPGSP